MYGWRYEDGQLVKKELPKTLTTAQKGFLSASNDHAKNMKDKIFDNKKIKSGKLPF